ncbi:hypothetical protein RHCRD62_70178 [Rhodococcus sp. RD6.2]|nr:hypothetical protein RHCRD62_70178 [Rhodococcus sp. RD6.2]
MCVKMHRRPATLMAITWQTKRRHSVGSARPPGDRFSRFFGM